MTIDEMLLAPIANVAAQSLLAQHPNVIFTSGRRSLINQAFAMATNVVKNRKWIEQTYLPSMASCELQLFVDENPSSNGVQSLTLGLNSVLVRLPPDEAGKISKHLSGMAFDIQPVTGPTRDAVIATIMELPGLDKFLQKEGGLDRFHLQFRDTIS